MVGPPADNFGGFALPLFASGRKVFASPGIGVFLYPAHTIVAGYYGFMLISLCRQSVICSSVF